MTDNVEIWPEISRHGSGVRVGYRHGSGLRPKLESRHGEVASPYREDVDLTTGPKGVAQRLKSRFAKRPRRGQDKQTSTEPVTDEDVTG